MMILPISTSRLTLRVMRPTDAEIFVSYRNDPDIARFQDWALPYPIEHALAFLDDQVACDDIPIDGWVQIAIDHRDEVIGDLAVGMSPERGVAQIGYTLRREFQGTGYASEALSALVDLLFDRRDVHRIEASVDPENLPSIRVLENQGFVYEGCARQAELIRERWVDDAKYALLRSDRASWLLRPQTIRRVNLVELNPDNVRQFSQLATHRSQERFVAPMSASFRDALVPELIDGEQVKPWMRGIEADGEPAGFIMIADVTDAHPDPYLWRLLIDRNYQRRGVGTAALTTLVDMLRQQGRTQLVTSWVDGPGGPRGFYERAGFRPTGNLVDGEVEGVLDLTRV